MTLEEYISKRKKEENIDEYDMQKHDKNLQSCVNYVFEYFDIYLRKDPDIEEKFLDKVSGGGWMDKYTDEQYDAAGITILTPGRSCISE